MKSLIKELRAYAHEGNKDCDIYSCPVKCGIHKLNLNHAIAWELASIIDLGAKHSAGRLNSLTLVIFLHKEKYPKLAKIARDLYVLLDLGCYNF